MRRCGAGVGVGTAMVGAVAVVVEVVVAAEGKVKPGGTVRGFNRLEEPGGGAGLRRTGAGGAGFRDRVGVGGREVPPLRTPSGDGNTVDTKQPPVRYMTGALACSQKPPYVFSSTSQIPHLSLNQLLKHPTFTSSSPV